MKKNISWPPSAAAVGVCQPMKKDNKKTTKKANTFRIDPLVMDKYNEQLTNVYGKNHRMKSTIIEQLLKQFNKQTPHKLKQYMEQEKDIINLNLEKITDCQEKITTLEQSHQDKEKQLADMEQKHKQEIQTLKQTHQDTITDIKELYEKEIQTLKDAIQDKEKLITDMEQRHEKEIHILNNAIQEKDKILDEYKATITNKDKTIAEKDSIITNKDKEIENSKKEYKTEYNKREHANERLIKAQNEINDLEHEIRIYDRAVATITSMHWFKRMIGKYPKEVLELTAGKDTNNNK